MALTERIFGIGILAMCLAIYNLWFQDMFLGMFGGSVGFGETALGYFVVGVISLVVVKFLLFGIRRGMQEEEEA